MSSLPRPAAGRRPVAAFVALCVLCLAAIGFTVVRAARRADPPSGAGQVPAGARATEVGGRGLLVRSTTQDRTFGRVAVDGGGRAGTDRSYGPLTCSRISFAAGRGVCLTVRRGVLSNYSAVVFDGRFRVERTVELAGIPSRTRVSPGGRVAATTVFVFGHSYADGNFSTQTSFIDLESGQVTQDMEDFTVMKDGSRVTAVDANYWGVTFIDDDRFYATLGTGGRTYLIEGGIADRSARVIRSDVECPSLSPDGRRLAFKRPITSGLGLLTWRLAVVDLGTGEQHDLAETRNVDDQVAWLDDRRVMYALTEGGEATPSTDDGQASIATDVWVVDADGGGRPQVLVKGASSPTVLRDR